MFMRLLVASATFYALALLGSTATAFDTASIDLATTSPDHHVIGAEQSDAAGRALVSGDFNRDGFEDLAIGATGADGPANGRSTAGEVYILFGPLAASTDLLSATPGYTVLGAAATNGLGWSLAAGDVNNDGIDDLAMGATGNNTTYVVFGSPSLSGTLDLLATPASITLTNSGGDALAIGDISADGIPDLAIVSVGSVSVIYGSSSLAGTINVSTTHNLAITGGDGLGTAIAIGDLNGDGRGDLAVTQPLANGPGASPPVRTGRAHVIFGSPTLGGTINLTTTPAGLTVYGADGDPPSPGTQPQDQLGDDVAVGDVDGDGFGDLLVSAWMADGVANAEQDVGETYLIRGSPGLGGTKDLAAAQYDLLIYGANVMDRSGERLHLADYNGDGNADITIEGGTPAGQVHVLYGSDLLTGTIDLSNYSNFTAIGAQSGDGLGDDLASIDANGDGAQDLVASALGADGPADGRLAAGEVYVVHGACDGVCGGDGADNDGDGVANALDSCPNVPEDNDGFQSSDGCPDPDNDNDGICDSGQTSVSCTGTDSGQNCFDPAGTLTCTAHDCRNVAEDLDAFKDTDGCPEPDNDNDGFPDVTDDCPGTQSHTGPDGMFGSPQDANHNGVRDGAEPAHTLDDVPLALVFEDQDGVLDTDGCHDSPGDDYDGDGLTDDNEVFTALTLPYNPDTDADTHSDGTDNCPLYANASQSLPTWSIPTNDGDCDGYSTTVQSGARASENFLTTDPTLKCARTATLFDEQGPEFGEPRSPWPTDINDDGRTTLTDALAFGPVFNSISGTDAEYRTRFDWNGNGSITLQDILQIAPFFNKDCDA